MAAKSGAVIVTNTIRQAEEIERMAHRMKVKINKPLSVYQIRNETIGREKINVLIDNAEWILRSLLDKVTIEAITIDEDDVVVMNVKR